MISGINKEDEKAMRAIIEWNMKRFVERHDRNIKRMAFIKKHSKKILALSMDGWPRTRQMKDIMKWMELVYQAKIHGIYGFGTSNCDVIAQLARFAKEFIPKHKK